MTARFHSTETLPDEALPACRVYRVPEAARLFGISAWSGYQQVQRTGHLGGVRAIRLGRRVVLPAAAVDAVLRGESSCTPNGTIRDGR